MYFDDRFSPSAFGGLRASGSQYPKHTPWSSASGDAPCSRAPYSSWVKRHGVVQLGIVNNKQCQVDLSCSSSPVVIGRA